MGARRPACPHFEAKAIGSSVGTRDDMRAVLELAAGGKLRCLTETQPLSDVNA